VVQNPEPSRAIITSPIKHGEVCPLDTSGDCFGPRVMPPKNLFPDQKCTRVNGLPVFSSMYFSNGT